MPTGLKATSAPIAVSFSVQESGPGVFTQGRVNGDGDLEIVDWDKFLRSVNEIKEAVEADI